MANGTFTSSALLRVQAKARQMFAQNDPQVRHLMMDDFGTIRGMLARQMADVTPFNRDSAGKDRNVTVHWLEHVPQALADPCEADCDFTGQEAGSYSEDKTLSDCVEYAFTVDESKFHNSHFGAEDALAKLFLVADHTLAANLNADAKAFLDANIGTSTYQPSAASANDATGLSIGAPNWNSALFAQLQTTVKRNKFNAPFMIGGIQLAESAFLQQTDTEAGAAGRIQRWGLFDIYYDTDANGVGGDANNSSYILNAASYAVAIKNNETATPVEYMADRRKYSFASQFLPGVSWDVYERKECVGVEDVKTHYLFKARTGFFLAPKYSQAATNTGILKLKVA